MITERTLSRGSLEFRPSIHQKLTAFLSEWLGSWPPDETLEIVSWSGRDLPGWDGGTRIGLGIESAIGTVLSVSPSLNIHPHSLDFPRIRAAMHALDAATAVPALLGHRELIFSTGTFRWSDAPAALPEVGEWVAADDPRVPAWLGSFNGDVLVAWDREGRYAAGAGRKQHNRYGHELSVGTEPGHRGRGLASKLVAQAARRVIADGAIPIYLHDPSNIGSRRVAEAAGFADRGWRILELR